MPQSIVFPALLAAGVALLAPVGAVDAAGTAVAWVVVAVGGWGVVGGGGFGAASAAALPGASGEAEEDSR